ncbi:MAG: MarR family transcriptional regulator [Elusimicrobia bacterium]|nr:MarR family transcriptional regulator [Elusimicrobiota bacterium]
MTIDIVKQLGYLTLGTRLKRLGERLQADTQRVIEACDLRVPAAQFPFLAAIDRQGPLAIGELARSVGVTQPGATRAVGLLVKAGLVTVESSSDDQRRKKASLTTAGRRLVAAGKRTAWPMIESAVRDLCRELDGSLLDQLAAIEDGLLARPLHRRVEAMREGER